MVFRKLLSSPGKIVCLAFVVLAILGLIFGISVPVTTAFAQTPVEHGQAIFEQKCQGCHSIGGGRRVGPDLKGITAIRDKDWLIRFITIPDKIIAQGDPIAKELVQQYGLPMPNLNISDEDAGELLVYIEAKSAGNEPAATPATVTPPITTIAGSIDAETGKDLFTGKLALKNGGPACLSCHNVNSVELIGGGTVGKDLTKSYSTFGEAGIISLLKTTPFSMMKEIYTAKPLTDEEIAGVIVFLKSAGSATSIPAQNSGLFFIIAAVGALAVIGLFQWLWRGRLAGVRRPLVKGGSK